MKLLLSIFSISVLAGIATWFFPWWMIAVCAFIIPVLLNLGAGKGFVSGALGIMLLWLVVILMRDIPNQHILSSKMATIILGSPNYTVFILITIVLGGLIGGLSGLTAGLMNRAFRK
ncbi:MAG: hypothetical protein BGO70_09040 [Bacteroidetes bacterium 43-93]|nr:hypothetical protein [Bacteroidota bacterium]OJX00311.1 MAG: hypothetical protein BGO70_09040 [Bacteroidetes bacterium 43-93]